MIDRREFLAALSGTAAVAAVNVRAYASAPGISVPERKLAMDPLRPQYHFLPPKNWMNDPNGPIYWNGGYHMFYQYNPDGAYWGNMHWGHAVSPDMVHWKHLPVALSPTPGGPDANGCFTGTAVVQDGQVLIMYTGVKASSVEQATIKDATPPLCETQCLAVAADSDLRTWSKASTPVIAAPPPQLEVNGFRDPSPRRQDEWWYTVVATGIANQGGAVLLYRSRDLRSWEYLHILTRRDRTAPAAFDPFDPWEVWECPELFPLADRHVLIFSTAGKTYWQSGKLDEQAMTFHPEQAGILDYGSYYAAKTQLDKQGNRVVWGWIPETRPLAEYKSAGWAGLMSLPRVLTLTSDGRLRIEVAGEVNQLRAREQTVSLTGDEQADRRAISGIGLEGCNGEILLKVRKTAGPFELLLSGSETDAPAWFRLRYDPLYRDQVFIDARPVPVVLGENEDLEFHFYADGSVVELLVSRQIAWTRRFYYSGTSPQTMRLDWKGATAEIQDLSIWRLSPISNDRLTT